MKPKPENKEKPIPDNKGTGTPVLKPGDTGSGGGFGGEVAKPEP